MKMKVKNELEIFGAQLTVWREVVKRQSRHSLAFDLSISEELLTQMEAGESSVPTKYWIIVWKHMGVMELLLKHAYPIYDVVDCVNKELVEHNKRIKKHYPIDL